MEVPEQPAAFRLKQEIAGASAMHFQPPKLRSELCGTALSRWVLGIAVDLLLFMARLVRLFGNCFPGPWEATVRHDYAGSVPRNGAAIMLPTPERREMPRRTGRETPRYALTCPNSTSQPAAVSGKLLIISRTANW